MVHNSQPLCREIIIVHELAIFHQYLHFLLLYAYMFKLLILYFHKLHNLSYIYINMQQKVET